jgi:hypothetical protein
VRTSVARGSHSREVQVLFASDCHLSQATRDSWALASVMLERLRQGSSPPGGALEWGPYVEEWTIVPRSDLFTLTGTAWRLPLSRSPFSAPLLAIRPAAGWARTLEEWINIGEPGLPANSPMVQPDEVAQRAADWIGERQLAAQRGWIPPIGWLDLNSEYIEDQMRDTAI